MHFVFKKFLSFYCIGIVSLVYWRNVRVVFLLFGTTHIVSHDILLSSLTIHITTDMLMTACTTIESGVSAECSKYWYTLVEQVHSTLTATTLGSRNTRHFHTTFRYLPVTSRPPHFSSFSQCLILPHSLYECHFSMQSQLHHLRV